MKYVTYYNAKRLYKVLSHKYVEDVETGDVYEPGSHAMYEALIVVGNVAYHVVKVVNDMVFLNNGYHIKLDEITIKKGNMFNFNNVNEHENRLQESEAPQRGGSISARCAICGRANEARIAVQSLSNKALHS